MIKTSCHERPHLSTCGLTLVTLPDYKCSSPESLMVMYATFAKTTVWRSQLANEPSRILQDVSLDMMAMGIFYQTAEQSSCYNDLAMVGQQRNLDLVSGMGKRFFFSPWHPAEQSPLSNAKVKNTSSNSFTHHCFHSMMPLALQSAQ